MRKIHLILVLCLFSLSVLSQKKETKNSKKWDVNNPHKDWKYNTFNLKTTEGTWMNLDVSPDGKTIVFDLLGDIYTMPISPCEQVAFEFRPNPVIDFLNTTIVTKFEANVNIYIFDKNGTIKYAQRLNAVTWYYLTIPMNTFDPGVYVMLVESNGVTKVSKFVKWNT